MTATNDLRVLGLQEIAVLLGVDERTPHAWKYRKVLPPPDHATVNGLNAWDRATIIEWAAATGRLPAHLVAESKVPVAERRGGPEARRRTMSELVDAGLLDPSALPKPKAQPEGEVEA